MPQSLAGRGVLGCGGAQRPPWYNPHGVIAIDNTLVDHSGKLIEDVGWLWDHAQQRHVIAHDYLISNYVCPSGSHPIEWRRFRKKDSCPAEDFKDHTTLCLDLIDDALARDIPGDFTFDSYFTHAKVEPYPCQAASLRGCLEGKVVFDGQEQKLQEVAGQIPFRDESRAALRLVFPNGCVLRQ